MKPLVTLVLGIFLLTACQSQQSGSLDAVTFQKSFQASTNAVLLDVRTPAEFAKGFIATAINMDYNNEAFENEINKLDKAKTYYVYCLGGSRSKSAADFMRSNGFKNVLELKGGILAWQKNNLPLTNEPVNTNADKISFAAHNTMIAKGTVLIDYYAPWCLPCKKMEPMLDELSKAYKNKATFIRLNIDENKQLATTLNVGGIPIFKIFKEGKEVWRHDGLIEQKELKIALDKFATQ